MKFVAELYDADGNQIGDSRELKAGGWWSRFAYAAALIEMGKQTWLNGGWVKLFRVG